jgi:phosphoribosyl-ATP pyrophosphohydrolase
MASANQLDALAKVIASRKGGDADKSYSAKLLAKGLETCTRKFGEEAVETMVAAMSRDKSAAISESADLLYHWLVLLAALEIDPSDVYAELARREAQSGLAEKASRSAS